MGNLRQLSSQLSSRQLRLLSLAALATFLWAGFVLVYALRPLWNIPAHLPEIQSLMSGVILDRNAQALQVPLNRREERASVIQLEELPDSLKLAFLISEDKRFFEHKGVDTWALLRAMYQSAMSGRWVSGASTLTMQAVRIHWPQLGQSRFKLAQMIQALRVEQFHSKSEILTHYLNLLPFAFQTIGLRQACLRFFDKSCDRLSLAESANLAVLPRNPAYYLEHPQALRTARNSILRRMFLRLQLDSLAEAQALSEPIEFEKGSFPAMAYHFVQRLSQEGLIRPGEPLTTSLDSYLQQQVQTLLTEHITAHPHLGDAGAILAVENKTGRVLVYVGSPGYFNADHGMVDAIQSLRSPGSALKPFIYAYALERGWKLSDVIPDLPIDFKVEKGTFSPRNYGGSFSGPQQLRFALANSKNIPVIFLTAQLGEASVLGYLRNLGFTSLQESSDYYGVGISLGNGEVSLWELVRAYRTLAVGGVYQQLSLLQNREPRDFFRAMDAKTAFLIGDVLRDPQARAEEFGRFGALEFDFPVAVKTGTSSSYRDHWTIGFSSDFTVGVWKGNADGSPLKSSVPSVRGAGMLFRQTLQLLQGQGAPGALPKPQGLVQARVCSLSGHLSGKHCDASREEWFVHGNLPSRTCDFHREEEVQDCNGEKRKLRFVHLPSEYQSWAEGMNLATWKRVLKEQCGSEERQSIVSTKTAKPEIISPQSGSILAFDPSIPSSHQKLRVQVSGARGRVTELLVNGKHLGAIKDEGFLDWPVTQGKYEFQLKVGDRILPEKTKIRVF